MDEKHSLISGLSSWNAPEPLPDDYYACIRDHPGFARAARTLAGDMAALAMSDRAIDGIFKDAGRYLAALCTAALHAEGVTLPRLKALCAGFGI